MDPLVAPSGPIREVFIFWLTGNTFDDARSYRTGHSAASDGDAGVPFEARSRVDRALIAGRFCPAVS
ncbi:hypothetical protein [Streptomyces sp. NBC_01716]|uniref:hypothetical protein n=1 Tax=Streptomyces sp. NBC_01716 TaxID=2975917 RepID=UPI002E2F5229|nr:hypothetical protein [Streptomyces sp. NBC_01716]